MTRPPTSPGWVAVLARLGDWLLTGSTCRHHWHVTLLPGGGNIARGSYYTCCACPARRRRRPGTPGARDCTRYTP